MNLFCFKPSLMLFIAMLPAYFSTLPAQAQSRDSLVNVYNSQTIHAFGTIYIKGRRRLSFRELSTEFRSDLTRDLYKKSKQNRTLSQVLTVISAATLVGSAVLRNKEKKVGYALLAVGIGLNLGNLRLSKKSTELVDRALWQRNKEVLFNP